MTFRRIILPLVLPAVVAGSIFTFALTLGDYIAPTLVSNTQFIGNVVYAYVGVAGNQPLPRHSRWSRRDHDRVPAHRPPARRVRGPLMIAARGLRIALRIATAVTLAFMYIPIVIDRPVRIQRRPGSRPGRSAG